MDVIVKLYIFRSFYFKKSKSAVFFKALHVSIVMIRYFISVVVPAKASCKRAK